jgi:hypothetical protein
MVVAGCQTNACCKAKNAYCGAQCAGISEKEYCEQNPGTVGCGQQDPKQFGSEYQRCENEGGIIMESWPRQCKFPDGRVVKEGVVICEDGSCWNVDECPEDYDEYGAQAGPACVKHYDKKEISAWPECRTSTACGDLTCAYASKTTEGQDIAWLNDKGAWRCIPDDYSGYLINMGMRTLDENGQESVVIA